MAEFKRSYDESETMEGDYSMADSITGSGMGPGFVGGLLVGGLAGWAFGRDRNFGNYGPGFGYPYPVNIGQSPDTFSVAQVDGIIATKEAECAQMNAIQQTRYEILNQMSNSGIDLVKDIYTFGNQEALLSAQTNANIAASGAATQLQMANNQGATQLQLANNAAATELCCCRTQGKIDLNAAETNAKIDSIVPAIQNFYLADEVEKLRINAVKTENAYQFGALTTQLFNVGRVVDEVYAKVNTTTAA